MIATLMRSGSNQCTLNDRRSYDAWGGIRTGNTTGEPHGRYCANLGHLADDESGFTYMRARYYEPGTGRFVSEDPGRQGDNWFAYCSNNPANRSDRSGVDDDAVRELYGLAVFALGLFTMVTGIAFPDPATAIQQIVEGRFASQAFWHFFKTTLSNDFRCLRIGLYDLKSFGFGGPAWKRAMESLDAIAGGKSAMFGLAGRAVVAVAGYVAALYGEGIYLGLWD